MMFISGKMARVVFKAAATCTLILTAWAHPAQAAIVLNGTRLVIPSDARSVTLSMQNTGNVPVLAQNWIDDGRQDAMPADLNVPFMLTPAIARVEPGGSAVVRISYTGEPLPTDRESLFYLNVMETPPRESESTNALMFSIRTRIKIFFRPVTLRQAVGSAAGKLDWTLLRDKKGRPVLQVTNPTPFHLTLVDIVVMANNGRLEAGNGMVAPFDTSRFVLPGGGGAITQKGLTVRYETVNDHGGFQKVEQRLRE